jgi:RNA polymerase sigma-70 factor (ECF subfamily)
MTFVSDPHGSANARPADSLDAGDAARQPAGGGRRPRAVLPTPPPTPDTLLAIRIRELATSNPQASDGPGAAAAIEEARHLFGELVATHQRRAVRIAYQYLRDTAEADEAVQDAFVKVFQHIGSYREAWPFEVWFTRILINGCLDRRKSRARRERWLAPLGGLTAGGGPTAEPPSAGRDPEALVLARERRERLAGAIDRLGGRQRTVFMLCHFGDHSAREISAMTGLNESTVRVHLFRAARKLRQLLGAHP